MKHGLFLSLVAAFAMSCADGGPLALSDDFQTSELKEQNPLSPKNSGEPSSQSSANDENNPNSEDPIGSEGANDPGLLGLQNQEGSDEPGDFEGLSNTNEPGDLEDEGEPEASIQLYEEPEASDVSLPRTAEFRIRGAQIDGLLAAVFTPSDLLVKVDGVEVPFSLHEPSFDLSLPNHAWKFVTFELPEGAELVEVLLAVDPERSYFATASEEGHIEAPGLPIMFTSPAHLIESRGKLVLELNLERSLVASAENERELLPFFRVDY